MSHILTTRKPVLASRAATIAFALVYLSAMALVLAPKGSFGAAQAVPSVIQTDHSD